jgi:hypothetical protein
MLVIAKKKIMFRMEPRVQPVDAEGKPRAIGSLAELSKARHHLVEASANPQDIPEWVGQTQAFRHAAQDGSITQIRVVTVEKPVTSFEHVPVEAEDAMAADIDSDVIDERHVKFIQSRGYQVETVEEAEAFIDRMSAKDKASYFADFEKAQAAAQAKQAEASKDDAKAKKDAENKKAAGDEKGKK